MNDDDDDGNDDDGADDQAWFSTWDANYLLHPK